VSPRDPVDPAVSADDFARAILNVLGDFAEERDRLEAMQRAVLNILEDFDDEKNKVESANLELRREVAERQAAEEALRRSNADLEQFAYVASHDLQEPLRMVSSYVELFARRYAGQVDPQARKYIDYAVDGAKRMQSLINALLEYSRVGRREQPARVSPGVALGQALENLRTSIEEAGARVTSDSLPEVIVDGRQLVQVFQNLVGNALKFRRPEVPPRVHVSARIAGDEAIFGVHDNGIGLDPRYADRIFVIFQRLHTRDEYAGTGIGLSIAKKVIDRAGGRIWVESEPGQGSTFLFTLPLARELP
jgi:light-regulated signal transduction histidine kinase (bacteriophytochrome)